MTLTVAQPLPDEQMVIAAVPVLKPLMVMTLPFSDALATEGLVLPGMDRSPDTFEAVMPTFWPMVTVAAVCVRYSVEPDPDEPLET